MNNKDKIYFIDDEKDIRIANQQTLELAGYDVITFESAKPVLDLLNEQYSGVIICDICLPGFSGQDFLKHALQVDQDLVVILITGHGDISMAVDCMRFGAYDFIEKPFAADRLVDSVKRGLDKRQLILDNRALRNELEIQNQLGPRIIGNTAVIKALRK
ncbi:MAG: sigma-54-dependent Fis family transcriptional regulator, partial [Gammaproteobacteria bacterium]|nr:sigma-54-dependent Fis family transcriptional regulator [Gammaproteobacteria bacterium]